MAEQPHKVTEVAKAKINLALHVLSRQTNGYHELDSAVAFATVGDVLTFAYSAEDSFSLNGPFAADLHTDERNIVLRARDAFRTQCHIGSIAITLEKNLPVASGIGGGSADAAATLRGLNRLALKPLPHHALARIALQLGADVPVCLLQSTCRMRGIGEQIGPLDAILPAAIVLANPRFALATKDVFARLGLAPGQPYGQPMAASQPALWRNDLETPALELMPAIAGVLSHMRAIRSLSTVRMSGSGATCFGLCADTASAIAAAGQLRNDHPDWWVVSAGLA